ncbi:MAG: hypothetical protein EOM38_06165 [Bacilli bacterium]|nr:hypothetical protein [Bacilli bacterium]
MVKYDEISDKYVPLASEKANDVEIDTADNKYLTDFEDFNTDEPSYIDEGAKDGYILELSENMWTKASSKAVRKIIYLFMRWCAYWVLKLQAWVDKTNGRQDDVEKRQNGLENQFKDVLANATTDSEVINARDSQAFGKFTVLDDRLENIEKLLSGFVPQGVEITIERTMDTLPKIYVDTWDYGIGMVRLGEEPSGLFGGTTPEIIQSRIVSWTNNKLIIQVPLDYEKFAFDNRPSDDEYLLFNGTKSLMVHVDGGRPIGEADDKTKVTVTKNNATVQPDTLAVRVQQLETQVGDLKNG